MTHIMDIIFHVLPEIFMAGITLLCGLMYKGIKKLKTQVQNSHKIYRYLLKENILRDYEKVMKQGYCSIETRRRCVDEYIQYKALGGNGGIEKIMEEIHDLPTYLQKTKGGGKHEDKLEG